MAVTPRASARVAPATVVADLKRSAKMTTDEAKKGVRKFLRGDGGKEINFAWLERSGDAGKDALLHALSLPSTSKKNKMTIKGLLVAFFFSPEVERKLLEHVRSHPNPRAQEIDERILRHSIAHREETRSSLLKL